LWGKGTRDAFSYIIKIGLLNERHVFGERNLREWLIRWDVFVQRVLVGTVSDVGPGGWERDSVDSPASWRATP
jgi:hypothetical protein